MRSLRIGEIMEEWTHKKSVADLASAMSLHIEKVWLKTNEGEVLIDVNDVQLKDQIIVRTGNIVPFDGVVLSGEASKNTMTIRNVNLLI